MGSEKWIVSPLQEGLSLARSAIEIHRPAVGTDLTSVTREGAPTLDLKIVDGVDPAAHVVSAVPLEPTAWIGFNDPPLFLPVRKRHAAFDAESVF